MPGRPNLHITRCLPGCHSRGVQLFSGVSADQPPDLTYFTYLTTPPGHTSHCNQQMRGHGTWATVIKLTRQRYLCISRVKAYSQSRLLSRQMSYSTTDLTPPVHVPWMPPDGLDIAAHGRNLLHANSKMQAMPGLGIRRSLTRPDHRDRKTPAPIAHLSRFTWDPLHRLICESCHCR